MFIKCKSWPSFNSRRIDTVSKISCWKSKFSNFVWDGQHFISKIIAISFEYVHFWRKINMIFVSLPWKLDSQYCHNVYGQRTRAGIRSTHGRRNVWGRGEWSPPFSGRLSIPIPNGGRLCPPHIFIPAKIFDIPALPRAAGKYGELGTGLNNFLANWLTLFQSDQ